MIGIRPRLVPAVVLLSVMVGLVLAAPVDAGGTRSATIDARHPLVRWLGPQTMLAVNPTTVNHFVDQPPDCSGEVVLECEDFVVTVGVGRGAYEQGGGLRVSITWGLPASDYDLHVYRRNGRAVDAGAQAATSEEHVFIPKATGTYVIRVIFFLVVDDQYTGTARLRGLRTR